MSLSFCYFVILNAVKDLALGLCQNICEILRVAQNDTNADTNANLIPIFYGRGLQQPRVSTKVM